MPDIEQLVERFREKLLITQEIEKFKAEVATPLANKIFVDKFAKTFEDLANTINAKLNSKVISFQLEGKNRFIVEGQFHRVYFQKGKIDILDNFVNVHIIPIYIWKGVTKHLGPISFIVNPITEEIKWDIPFENVEEYSRDLFGKLVEDQDFSM